MRNTLLLLLFFYGNNIYSQNFENIKKIQFNYSYGNSSWGKNGIFSRNEIIEITKNENGEYTITQHIKVKEKVFKKIFSKDTISIETNNNETISKTEIDFLLNSLNLNKENFTTDFLFQNFKKPTKKEILKIAKENNYKDYLKNDYDEKEEIENKYLEIQNFNYFDEYLTLNKPNLNEFTINSDGWNKLEIITFSKDETKLYKLDFLQDFGQPISTKLIELSKKEKKVIIVKEHSSIINLNVNTALLKILRKNEKLITELNLNNIRDAYIKWFLENKTRN